MREDRRSVLKLLGAGMAGSAALAATGAVAGETKTPLRRPPPPVPSRGKGFLWGTASSAYQFEGNNYASDLWPMEYLKPSIFKQPSGDADDSYNRVEGDIALAAELGMTAYRLSVEWSRIQPEPNQVSRANLAYYRRVLASIRAHGMLPVVTYMHYTSPRWFAAAGGFEVRKGIGPFLDYARVLTQELGDLMGLATTFNEPNIGALVSTDPKVQAMVPYIAAARKQAAKKVDSAQYAPPMLGKYQIQQPIMIEAHNQACHVIHQASGGRLPVGVTLSLNEERGKRQYVEAKEAIAMLPWLEADGDWVGVQNYTWTKVGPNGDLPYPKGTRLTQMGYPYAPESCARVVRTVARHWKSRFTSPRTALPRKTTPSVLPSLTPRWTAWPVACATASTCAATCTGPSPTTGSGSAATGPNSAWLRWTGKRSSARPSPVPCTWAGSPAVTSWPGGVPRPVLHSTC